MPTIKVNTGANFWPLASCYLVLHLQEVFAQCLVGFACSRSVVWQVLAWLYSFGIGVCQASTISLFDFNRCHANFNHSAILFPLTVTLVVTMMKNTNSDTNVERCTCALQAKRNTEDAVMSARERYLARKRKIGQS